MVDFNQLHQSGFIAIAFDDKAALALIVNMFVVQIGELNEGLVRLFKPVAHDAGVVIELVDEAQIFALKRAEFDVSASVSGDSCGQNGKGITERRRPQAPAWSGAAQGLIARPVRRSRQRRVFGSQ